MADLLKEALARGAARYPSVQVGRTQLAAFLSARASAGPAHLEDLYLAAALCAKDPGAVALFQTEHLAKLGPALSRLSLSAADEPR